MLMLSINSACKFKLIGSLHCDNRTVYITNAWDFKNAMRLKLSDNLISDIFRLKTLF